MPTHTQDAISHFTTQDFSIPRFKSFIQEVFGQNRVIELRNEDFRDTQSQCQHIKKAYYLLASPLELEDQYTLEFYVFEVKSIKAKIGLHQDLKIYLNNTRSSAILACFYESHSLQTFRLTLINYTIKDGKVDYSHPKRQSFVLGKGENTKTAIIRLKTLAKDLRSSFELSKLTEAFSLEPVTNEFFKKYKELYEGKKAFLLQNHAIFKRFEASFPLPVEKSISFFVKKLLGRIVFLYFIQKKGWLGVPRDSQWGDGDKQFLKTIFDNKDQRFYSREDDFYSQALIPLFFDSLNQDRGTLSLSTTFGLRIPFLNGGLFESTPIDRDPILCEILDKAFFQDIFDLFEQYNFTIDESTPQEIEVGIDPEMLGKVFENLIDYNKATGAFYTRRGIVNFMCKNALILHLVQVFGEEHRHPLESLVYDAESDNEFVRKNGSKIKDTLSHLKILDPAIGSGAYPMGLLNAILSVYMTLDKTMQGAQIAHCKRQIIENNIYGIDIDFDAIEIAKLRFWLSIAVDEETPSPLPNLDFKFMQGNSLLETLEGLSLLPQDFLISKDRDLIEEKGSQKDCTKYLYEKSDFITSIQANLHLFFKSNHQEEKQRIKGDIRSLIQEIIQDKIEETQESLTKDAQDIAKIKAQTDGAKSRSCKKFETTYQERLRTLESAQKFQKTFIEGNFCTDLLFLYKLFFAEVFQEGGFDIVIGNPPYIRQEDIPLKNRLKEEYKGFFNANADIFTYFFKKGFEVLKPQGILSLITSNKWARAGYGKNLREFILQTQFSSYVDFNGLKAFNATVDTSITTIVKSAPKQEGQIPILILAKEQDSSKVLDDENLLHSLLTSTQTIIPQSSLSPSGFTFVDQQTLALKTKIESIGTPLKDWDISINYGIKTGYNDAFIIDTAKREEILANCKSEEERDLTSKLIRKMLRGRDIKRYSYEWAGLWIIATFPSLKLDIDDYPALKAYLQDFRPRIDQSGEKGCRKKTSNQWFETQDNIAYWQEFEGEKIVYPNMKKEFVATLDDGALLTNQKCFILTSNTRSSLKYLVAILNSKLNFYYFKQIGATLGATGYEMSKIFVERLCIPQINSTNQKTADEIVKCVQEILECKAKDPRSNTTALQSHIDSLVYTLYNLTEEEIAIIENKE